MTGEIDDIFIGAVGSSEVIAPAHLAYMYVVHPDGQSDMIPVLQTTHVRVVDDGVRPFLEEIATGRRWLLDGSGEVA